jgi:hypothetical protein
VIKTQIQEADIKWLRSTPFFGKWSRSMLVKLMILISEVTVHKDKVLTTEGEINKNFYLIREGNFELTKKVRKPVDFSNPSENFMKEEIQLVRDRNNGKSHEEFDRNGIIEGEISKEDATKHYKLLAHQKAESDIKRRTK